MLRVRGALSQRVIRASASQINLPGFTTVATSSVEDLKLQIREMKHEKSQAKWIHIQKPEETQKVFNICFRTVPETDNGVAHILEHLVLCGSQKYPVRDPFFKMINRSLNSFMNAMTGTDYTMYPFATSNEKDFQNLLSVYLDAVFRPNLRPLDFLQEAWRLGEGNDETDLIFKGVVFNEMKGAMSDKEQIFFRRLISAVCPSNTYQYNSGGEPLDIPSLTYSELKKFHADHYNPANSQIITYGDVNLPEAAAQISEALSSVPSGKIAAPVPKEAPWTAPRHLTFSCPWNASAQNLEKQSSAALAWSVGDRNDIWLNFVGEVVGSLLTSGASSPLYKELIESGLGSEYSTGTGFWTYLKDSMFVAGLSDCSVADLDKVHELVTSGLEKAAKDGFPSDRIEAIIHQLELSTRHQSVKFGLGLTMNIHPGLLHGADMNESLQTLSHVDRLKSELVKNPNFLRDQIGPMLLSNPHCAFIKMIPNQNYEQEQVKLESDLLDTHLHGLTREDRLKCIDTEMDLEEEQAEPPNVDCLPTLTIGDIPVDKKRFCPVQTGEQIHYQKTSGSGLTYIRGLVELDGLTPDEVDLLPAYESLLTRIGRGEYDYRQIGVEQDLTSGGFSVSSGILTDFDDTNIARPALNVYTYGLDSKLDRITSLLDSLLVPDGPDFDPDRIRVLISEAYSGAQSGIVGSGHTYSMAHSHSYINSFGNLNERLGGLTAVQNLKALVAADDWSGLAQRLVALHAKICGQHARFLVHSDADQTAFVQNLSGAKNRGGAAIPTANPLNLQNSVNKTTWDLGFPINYVSRAFPTVPNSHPDSAPLSVLASMMGAKFLLREIREAGGAYGAGASHLGGAFRFFSYRDPSGLATLGKFKGSVEWVLKKSWTERDVHEAILKVFQGVDEPVNQSSQGVSIWKNNLTVDQLDEKRARLLAVTESDLLRVAETYLVDRAVMADTIIGPTEAILRQNENNLAADHTKGWNILKL